MTRTCKACGDTKPLETGFYRVDKNRNNQYTHKCRTCINAMKPNKRYQRIQKLMQSWGRVEV